MPPPPLAGAEPVRFDDAVADAAIAHLVELREILNGVVRADGGLVPDAVTDWEGGSRRWFDGEHAAVVRSLLQARDRVTETIDALRRAKVQAARIQETRNALAQLVQRAEQAADQLGDLVFPFP